MNQNLVPIVILIAVFLFVIFRRIRRNIGLQRLRQGNLLFRIILFSIFGLIFLIEGAFHKISLISDTGGIILGAILALYGISLTTIEERNGQMYYRPNTWIGSIVILMSLIRFFYHFYVMFSGETLKRLQEGQAVRGHNNLSALHDSWTAGTILIMFAYYVIYYIILLKRQKIHPTKNVN